LCRTLAKRVCSRRQRVLRGQALRARVLTSAQVPFANNSGGRTDGQRPLPALSGRRRGPRSPVSEFSVKLNDITFGCPNVGLESSTSDVDKSGSIGQAQTPVVSEPL